MFEQKILTAVLATAGDFVCLKYIALALIKPTSDSVDMKLFLPESAFTKLFAVLMLLSEITACQAIPAKSNPALKQSSFNTSASQLVQVGDTSGELFNQRRQRTYYMHTPKSYQPNRPLPLVLAFHEYGGNGEKMAASTGLNALAEQKGFIVVYPDAVNKRWDIDGHAQTGVNDVAFVSALITHLTQIRAVDRQRVYATGLSNGGYLVQRLACEMPRQFAAFASVAASLPGQVKPFCQPPTPVSIMMINGTADTVVPWEGGAPPKVRIGKNLSSLPVPQVIEFWRQHDACAPRPKVKQLSSDRVEVSQYLSCQNVSAVTLVTLKGGKHIWPGSDSRTSPFLDASMTIWDFFSHHINA